MLTFMFYYVSKLGWVIAEPGNFLVLLAIVGLALTYLGRHMIGRALIALPLVAISVVSVVPVGDHILARLEQRFPVWQDDGQPVDGIIVLGGAVNPQLYRRHSGSGMSAAIGRITAAAALAHRHQAARIVFAGGGEAGSTLTEAHVAAEIFSQLGIDGARIKLDTLSRNTSENAFFAKQLATIRPGERWVLVTSAFHMPRAIGCFRMVEFPVVPYPVDYRFSTPANSTTPWLTSSVVGGLTSLNLALHELIGLAVYRLSNRTTAWLPAP
jgi:uncharacterized SAM-binding protein YcdF (DUF218 family)